MEISDKNLQKFRTWLQERGRVDGTADLYCHNLRSCNADKKGLTRRLVAGDLAPNSLRTNLAALRAWALYTKDQPLRERLSDIRLPPARRVKAKQPIALDDWRKVIRHLQGSKLRCSDPMRQVLLIMAIRGLRSGDVLRLKRTEIVRALSTGKLVYEGKGRKRMEVSAEPLRAQFEALAALQRWERVRDLISESSDPRVLRNKVGRAARSTAREVGVLEVNPHRFRHTFATQYLMRLKGDPNALIKLKQYMGWESIATASRYVDNVSQGELDDIGAALIGGLLDG